MTATATSPTGGSAALIVRVGDFYCDTTPLADAVAVAAFFYPPAGKNHCPPGCAASVVSAFGICFGVQIVGDRIGHALNKTLNEVVTACAGRSARRQASAL